MIENIRDRMLKEKLIYLEYLNHRIKVLEQKDKNNSISSKESVELRGLYRLEYRTRKEMGR